MLRCRLVRKLFSNTVKQAEEQAVDKVPVYMKPYDGRKYEKINTKLKYSSGYAFLELEPFPRARLMRLGYLILDKIKDCPADSNYRMFTEEKIRWIMEKVDETEDIEKLEEIIGGGDAIEITIQELNNEYKLIDFALGRHYSLRNQAMGDRPRV